MTGVQAIKWHPELINLLRRRPELYGVGISAMVHVVVL